MLIIKSKFPKARYVYGSGFFDTAKNILQRTANLNLGKKVVDLKKVANSSLAQELKDNLLTGVGKVTKTGVSKVTENIVNNYSNRLKLPLSNKKRKRKTSVSKAKRKKGNGIIWE